MSGFWKAALVAATLTCASQSEAATIVQTVRSVNGPAYGEKFNPVAGTLTSVTVTAQVFQQLYFEYMGPSSGSAVSLVGKLENSPLGSIDITGDYQASQVDPRTVGFTIRESYVATETSDFRNFIGTNLLTFGVLAQIQSATVNGRELLRTVPSFPGQAGGTFTIEYNFIPAIPEPSTWALMLAGFGLTGYALRRRRSRVAFA